MEPEKLEAADKWRLLITKLVLFVCLVGIAVLGRQIGAWPIVTWPMYSDYVMKYPPDWTSTYEFRATTTDGTSHTFDIYRFYPFGRDVVVTKLVDGARMGEYAEKRARFERALFAMVSRALPRGEELDSFQVWEITWDVDPLDTPPLDRSLPSDESLVLSVRNP